ncbi:MAG TPA: glycosyltransferase family 1 protein [Nitrospirae bacterium]|nr:spore coat protein SA [bacterium BMS3Abin06]HDH12901.1 glycosyltransferase family 1 protein [Nitrospirota bacterium]HDZ01687.1 glycosyltransferase family 1 protein [Nitrospirota bacterium]
MKVAIVSNYLPKYHRIWSGAEIIAVTLADILKSKKCEVFFITLPFDFEVADYDYKVYSIKASLQKLGTVSRNFPLDISAIINVYRKLKQEKPDIVHINAKYLFIPTMIACNILKIPALFTVPDYFILCPTMTLRKTDNTICRKKQGFHCYQCITSLTSGTHGGITDALHGLIKMVPKLLLGIPFYIRAKVFNCFINKVDAFVVLSNSSMNRLIDYGIPKEKVNQIYHYKLGMPKETNEKITNPSVLFAGKFSRENGTDILLEAFSETAKKIANAKLYLVGWPDESFREEMEDKIATLDIKDSVIILGKRDNAEILSLISKCDTVVVPHQWPKEFGPVILIEALAMGKPVVTSMIGGTDEFISNGENGFLVENYKNPGAFSEKMVYLLSDTSKAEEMGEKGKMKISFLFGEDSSNAMISLYNKFKGKRIC